MGYVLERHVPDNKVGMDFFLAMQSAESAPEKLEFRVELMSEFLWFVQFRWFRCIANFPVWAIFFWRCNAWKQRQKKLSSAWS